MLYFNQGKGIPKNNKQGFECFTWNIQGKVKVIDMKKQTLEHTLTTIGLFPTFKATLILKGVNLDIARFYVYTTDNYSTLISEADIDDIEDMLPFFNALYERRVEVNINIEDNTEHYVEIILG